MGNTIEEKKEWYKNLSVEEKEVWQRKRNCEWFKKLSVKQQGWIKWQTQESQKKWIKENKTT